MISLSEAYNRISTNHKKGVEDYAWDSRKRAQDEQAHNQKRSELNEWFVNRRNENLKKYNGRL